MYLSNLIKTPYYYSMSNEKLRGDFIFKYTGKPYTHNFSAPKIFNTLVNLSKQKQSSI